MGNHHGLRCTTDRVLQHLRKLVLPVWHLPATPGNGIQNIAKRCEGLVDLDCLFQASTLRLCLLHPVRASEVTKKDLAFDHLCALMVGGGYPHLKEQVGA